MKRTSISSEDSPLTPQQMLDYYTSLNNFFTSTSKASELSSLTQLFSLYDRNNDGKISKKELSNVMNFICPDLSTPSNIDQILSHADSNHDLSIDFQEFTQMMLQLKAPNPNVP